MYVFQDLSRNHPGFLANNEFVTKEEKTEMLDQFCARMELSGYPVSIASKVVTNGIKCFDRKTLEARKKEQMFHRLEDEGRLII